MDKIPSIGVSVMTHRAKEHLPKSLAPLLASPLKPRVLVVNSTSCDGTVEEAKRCGAETLIIPRSSFNHGTTRELARQFLNTEIVVMVTPDAYAIDETVLGKLVQPLLEKKASVAYARQIPHEKASFFESFPRAFNYPLNSHIRGIEDIQKYGVYTFFCSNSYAAWSNRALDEIGGFEPVLLGEDTVATAKLLQKGHKIAYVSEAIVKHSHCYTLLQEFQRHFDIGLARRTYNHLIQAAAGDTKRGKTYAKTLIKEIAKQKPHLLPYATLQLMMKWCGYQLGRRCQKSPLWLKRLCSSQDFYWTAALLHKSLPSTQEITEKGNKAI